MRKPLIHCSQHGRVSIRKIHLDGQWWWLCAGVGVESIVCGILGPVEE